MDKPRKKRAERQKKPRVLILSFKLRDGATRREEQMIVGMVAAAVDDAAGAYRALRGASPFDQGTVVSADASVATLH